MTGWVVHREDVLVRMQTMLPEIDENELLLKKVLPKIFDGKIIERSIQKQINRAVPKDKKM